jgi:spermidine/putrescine transport system permease protein
VTARASIGFGAFAALVIVFLFAPIVIVVLFSFDAAGKGSFPMAGFTLDHYRSFFDNPVMIRAAYNSAIIAIAATLVAVVLGTSAAFAIARYRVRLGSLFTGLIVLPIVIPPLLLAISLLSFFSRLGIELSLFTVIVGHVLVTMPFVVLTIVSRLAGLDPAMDEAAATLGATRIQTFRHVTFPLIRASVIGAALLVVALSVDEFIVTFFTIGSDNTLPTVIWGQMRAGVSPVVNAISTLMLAVTLVLVVLVRRLTDVKFR